MDMEGGVHRRGTNHTHIRLAKEANQTQGTWSGAAGVLEREVQEDAAMGHALTVADVLPFTSISTRLNAQEVIQKEKPKIDDI